MRLVPSLSACAARASYAKAQVGVFKCTGWATGAAFARPPHPNPAGAAALSGRQGRSPAPAGEGLEL